MWNNTAVGTKQRHKSRHGHVSQHHSLSSEEESLSSDTETRGGDFENSEQVDLHYLTRLPLENVALTISEDHTGDSLFAQRLLLLALQPRSLLVDADPNNSEVVRSTNSDPPGINWGFSSEPTRLPDPNLVNQDLGISRFGDTNVDDGFDFNDFLNTAAEDDFNFNSAMPPPEEQHSSTGAKRLFDLPQQALRSNSVGRERSKMAPVQQPPHNHYEPVTGLSSFDPGRSEIHQHASTSNGLRSNSRVEGLPMDLNKLQQYIVALQTRARDLERAQQQQEPSKVQILYRIRSRQGLSPPYLDHPQYSSPNQSSSQLRGTSPISNFELYLERNKDISLVVYRDFEEDHVSPSRIATSTKDDSSTPGPRHSQEILRPICGNMIEAIKTILKSKPEFGDIAEVLETEGEIFGPYLFFYHSRKGLKDLQKDMSEPVKRQLSIFTKYIYHTYGEEYAIADSLNARKCFLADYLCYLFKPNSIIVHKTKDTYRAYVNQSWLGHPVIKPALIKTQRDVGYNYMGKDEDIDLHKSYFWSINAWSWQFDGRFYREETKLSIEVICRPGEQPLINELSIYPLEHAEPPVIDRLRYRGDVFWKCRFHRLMSYNEEMTDGTLGTTGERYMLDLKTYHKLHANNHSNTAQIRSSYTMSEEEMLLENPPDEQFQYLLPATTKGFNLRRKKWLDLKVDQISDVEWNKAAFRCLVVENKTKDLIQALVSKQLSVERSTDLIADKGNGLILLLHGGPGTGKTLTAESVAEIAEKPLYRVTCGDIGIKADEVEKYLEAVLHLGKIWGCVVLLDEADVFLEQRTLEDLARNALVSVFLRVLEYYDGILVLTSNRVGTFDEAFKSRIQLALHYADLGEYQRQQIWTNFLTRLEGLGEDVDFSGLRDHIPRLAQTEMNGRQIRNAITTARQFAEWKKERLTYHHLEYVIEVSGRFEKYLNKLNGGFTDTQLAHDEGIR